MENVQESVIISKFKEYLDQNNYLVVEYDHTLAGVDGFAVTDMKRIIQESQINGEYSNIKRIVKFNELKEDLIQRLHDYYCRSWLNHA